MKHMGSGTVRRLLSRMSLQIRPFKPPSQISAVNAQTFAVEFLFPRTHNPAANRAIAKVTDPRKLNGNMAFP
jgi:hypothetical protein